MNAFAVIEEFSRHTINLEKVEFLLRWDADVTMPPQGSTARVSQSTSLGKAKQDLLTDDRLGAALEEIESVDLTADQAAIVREMRREYRVASEEPDELMEKLSGATSEAYERWGVAKQRNDWSIFENALQRHFELLRAKARAIDSSSDPLELLWLRRTGYAAQPHIDMDRIMTIFDDLKAALIPMIEAIEAANDPSGVGALDGTYPIEKQRELNEICLNEFGLDWDRSRFDTAQHPFSFGTQFDVRMTTSYDEDNLLSGLMATIHEFGHTVYTHNLPREQYGTPLGEPRGVAFHESQSRFFENHVGRSEAFWKYFLPFVQDTFPEQIGDLTARGAYEAANEVKIGNPRRTTADELTYHLHIILRTEIEQEVLENGLAVEDIPQRWAELSEAYLGVRPASAVDGPLQDPHWASHVPGFIGYTLGSVLAAQLAEALEADIGPISKYAEVGDFEPLIQWMRENVHRHGRRIRSDEMIEAATGEPLSADAFIDYVQHKYHDLYGI